MNRLEKDQNPIFIRDFYKKKLKKLSLKQRKEKNKKINQLLSLFPPLIQENSFVAFYKALETEPCLSETYSQFKEKGCFPIVEKNTLSFYTNPKNEWKKGAFGIEEPLKIKQNKIPLEKISLFFIPGTCFDRKNSRLGKGMGYYDKTLAKVKKTEPRKKLFIGVAFSDQIHNKTLPIKKHDIKMDFLVSNQFILYPLKKHSSQKRKVL